MKMIEKTLIRNVIKGTKLRSIPIFLIRTQKKGTRIKIILGKDSYLSTSGIKIQTQNHINIQKPY